MKIGYLMQQGVEIRRPPFNGPANHVRHVVGELLQRGHQVRVLVRLEGRLWQSDDLEQFEPVTVPWLDRGPLRWFERAVRRLQTELQLPYAGFFESVRFAQACRRYLADYDLLYERIGWPEFGGALASRWLKRPLVLEDNGDQLADLEAKGIAPRGMQRRLSLWLMGWAVKQAAHVVSTGTGWRNQFIARWGVEPERVTAVENGTTLVSLQRGAPLRAFQENGSGPAPDSSPTLVYVGGFYPWHGLPVLLPALARTRARGIPASLILIGAGEGLAEARELVDKLDLTAAVTFTGQLTPEAYAPILAGADIGLSPYCDWHEFSGLKILDYKASGLPTIASGRNGQPPTLSHEQTGLIVPPCDEAALSEAIIRLSTDQELRRQMGRRARREAEQLHGWDQTAARLEQIFSRVLAGKGS